MRRALASVALVAALASAGTAAYAAGVRAGEASVWQYVGPGDVTCDTDIPDVPDCWPLPDHSDWQGK